MKKKLTLIALSLVVGATLFFAGCGGDEVSMGSTEEMRTIARENSLLVAKQFTATNPEFTGYRSIPNGDSSISRSCPQGDGWASLKLISPGDTPKTVKIKCSTFSMGIGCLTAKDFAKKSYAAKEGTCDTQVEYPLKKIAN